jgi:putative ABC transport system ATP-binding protein
LIKIHNLTKTYPSGNRIIIALDSVSLTIPEGEFLLLVGKSGSGKSTLLNLLSGIDQPDRGQIWIQDREITRLNDHKLTLFRREHIGFVFQFFNLIPTLSVKENLLLPLYLDGRIPSDGETRALDLLAQVGLADRADSYTDQLSGGEQQRIAIARALIRDPALILADEPTGNLDSETGQQVIRLLHDLCRQRHKTVIMVTHNPEAASMADRVFRLRDGRLIS